MNSSHQPQGSRVLDDLLSQLCDDSLTSEGAAALNSMLSSDPAARQRYLSYMELHGSLHWNLLATPGLTSDVILFDSESAEVDESPSVISGDTMVLPALRETGSIDFVKVGAVPEATKSYQSVPRRNNIGRFGWIAIAATVVLSASIGLHSLFRPADSRQAVASLATVAGSVNAVWSEAEPQFTLPTILKSGEAKLRFENGTEVIVQGPAEFQVISKNALKLTRGQVVATVTPAARGFSIETPQARIVDLGTEFGVLAGESDNTEVHVFRGEVTVAPSQSGKSSSPESVTAGSAVKVTATGAAPASIPLASAQFIRGSDFEVLQHARPSDPDEAAYQRWLSTSLQIRHDPRVMAYYTFDSGGFNSITTVPNLAAIDRSSDAHLESAGFDTGRFSKKRAVDLHAPAGAVKVNIPGEVTKLTLIAWINARAINHRATPTKPFISPWSSLLMSDGYSPIGGYVHWQIDQGGGLSLSVNHRPPEPNYNSPPVIGPEQLRQWHQVATVYDLQGQRISFYIDGRRVQTFVPNAESPLTIGTARIGNWNPAGEPANGRSFDGKIDELIAFHDALTDADVAKLYDDTRPAGAPAAAQRGK